MAVPIGSIKTVALSLLVLNLAVVLALVSWHVLVSFLLPYVVTGLAGSAFIHYLHWKTASRLPREATLQGKHRWLRRNHMAFVLVSSLMRTAMVYSLCGGINEYPDYYSGKGDTPKHPSCALFRDASDPWLKRVGLFSLAYLFYMDLCVFVDICAFAFPNQRSPLYRYFVAWQSSIHFTATILALPTLPLCTVLGYVFARETGPSETSKINLGNFAPVFYYAFHYAFAVNGLYNSLVTYWNFVSLDMRAPFKNPAAVEYGKSISKTSSAESLLSSSKQTSSEVAQKYSEMADDKSTQSKDMSDDTSNEQPKNPTRRRDGIKAHTLRIHPERSSRMKDLSLDGDELKVIQITDPHIGSVMTVGRLRQMCEDIVAAQPDIVLLTGDYYTGDGSVDGVLAAALEPLKSISDRCFACLGNHDIETPMVLSRTTRELKECGITLLRNEQCIVDVPQFGKVQVFGFDYMIWRSKSRGKVLREIYERHPKPEDCRCRLSMLHDPSGFSELSGNEGTLVFSGHTHGGHVGFLACGLKRTMFSLVLPTVPDHGVFQSGDNILYVHRGQGSRGLFGNLVLRSGIPSEQTLVFIKC